MITPYIRAPSGSLDTFLSFNGPIDLYGRNFRFLRDAVRNNNDVLAAEEIQNPMIDALIRGAQLIDAISQKIGNRAPKLMPLRSQ
jgi:hypothetical protein